MLLTVQPGLEIVQLWWQQNILVWTVGTLGVIVGKWNIGGGGGFPVGCVLSGYGKMDRRSRKLELLLG